MAEIGWIKLNRQITENWIFPNRRKFTEFEAWIYLLLKSSFADSKVYDNGRLILINRGELLTSELKLSYEWLWDRGAVRRFLNVLQKDGMIFKKTTTKFTIVTICNYASYQDTTTTNKQQTNNRRTTNEQQTNTLEEGKESKEGKEGEEVPQQLFEMFRRAASRKITDQHLLTEIGKFINKYPEPKNHTASLVNAWCSRIEEPKPKFVM
jgi:hypothetical protein